MRRFTLPIDLVLTSIAILLIILCPRQAHGIVSDEHDGGSVSGVGIPDGDHGIYSDQAGRYGLGWIHSAPTLTVQANGDIPADASVPEGRSPGQAASLDILSIPDVLSGTVCDVETGDPLPGSTVTAGGLSLTADERGHYTLRRVKGGALLAAAMPGYKMSTAVFNGQGVQDFELHPFETTMLVLDLYSGQPVPNSSVAHGSMGFATDVNGEVVFKRLPKSSVLSARAVGYATTEFVYDGADTILIALRPNTLQGVVRDSTSGQPVTGTMVAVVSSGEVITSSITGADGRYTFSDLPTPITLVVAALDYDRSEIPVGPAIEMDVFLKRFQIRGIYLPFGLLTSEKRVRELIDLVERTELNAIVVDVKNDRGWLAYPSALVEAQRSKAYKSEVMDIGAFLSLCRDRGIYTIARLVVFKDSTVAAAYPEWAVRKENDELWTDSEGSSWGDPLRVEVQDYNIAIAKEVATLGFDELQFDYLRFPSDGAIGEIRYAQESTFESRCNTIKGFCARLHSELEPYAVLLSADLFGLTVWVSPEEDMGIGQRVIDIAPYMDYLSPMLYPATFVSGNLGYEDPLLHPYEVVYRSCVKLAQRTQTPVRPWLQHYSSNDVPYGVEEMRLQKQAATDAETHGWMFWHAAGRYDEHSFEPINSSYSENHLPGSSQGQ
jgi:hypothetical protein